MENQLGDVNHGPFLHSAVIPAEANEEIFSVGWSAVPEPGHGATFRLMPEGTNTLRWLGAWGRYGCHFRRC